MKPVLSIAGFALVLPVAALAVVSPARPAATAARPPVVLTPGVKRMMLSPEGRTIAARIYGTPDPRLTQLQNDLAAIRQEKLLLIAGPYIDVERLEPLLRREEAAQAELRTRQNDRLLVLLRALPEADRATVLQTMANPARPQSSKPADSPR